LKDGDAKPGIYNQARADQDRPAARKAKPGKPGDAKSWVYGQEKIISGHDRQTAEEFFTRTTLMSCPCLFLRGWISVRVGRRSPAPLLSDFSCKEKCVV